MKILVIGGSSGIGLGVVDAARQRGHTPIVVSRTRGDIRADVSREGDVARMFAEAGPVDHVVVTAMTLGYGAIATLEEAMIRNVLDNKLLAAMFIAKHAAGNVKRSLTFTSGINKDRPIRGSSVMTAVNGALGAFAKAMALELAPIRVNCVSPGWVETPVWDAMMGQKKEAALTEQARRLPGGRIGRPADIASAFLFVMENEFVTGTTLHVDGGHALV